MRVDAFLAHHPVFTLEALAAAGGQDPAAARHRLRYWIGRRRVKRLARGLFATVPLDVDATGFSPDPFLVARAARGDSVACHHAAQQLLGFARTIQRELTFYSRTARSPIDLGAERVVFLSPPSPLVRRHVPDLGVERVDRSGFVLHTTGPERALLDGLRRPRAAGGLEEVIEMGLAVERLHFDLLLRILSSYNERTLWAAAGWLLEAARGDLDIPEPFLETCRSSRPAQPQDLHGGQPGGRLVTRWNLIVAEPLLRLVQGHAPEP